MTAVQQSMHPKETQDTAASIPCSAAAAVLHWSCHTALPEAPGIHWDGRAAIPPSEGLCAASLGIFRTTLTQFELLSFVLLQELLLRVQSPCRFVRHFTICLFVIWAAAKKSLSGLQQWACFCKKPSKYGKVGVCIWDAHGSVSSKYRDRYFPTEGEPEFI